MAKKIVGMIKLQVPAGKANPSPPIGPALGQRGLNIMEFCKTFNAQTQNLEPGMPIPVVITAYGDRSFTFVTKTPPSAYFLKKAAGVEKGSQTAGKATPAGAVTMAQVAMITVRMAPPQRPVGTTGRPATPPYRSSPMAMEPKIYKMAERAVMAVMLGKGLYGSEMAELIHLLKHVAHHVKEDVQEMLPKDEDQKRHP